MKTTQEIQQLREDLLFLMARVQIMGASESEVDAQIEAMIDAVTWILGEPVERLDILRDVCVRTRKLDREQRSIKLN